MGWDVDLRTPWQLPWRITESQCPTSPRSQSPQNRIQSDEPGLRASPLQVEWFMPRLTYLSCGKIPSFSHPFILQTFIGHLRCVRHSPWQWEYSSEWSGSKSFPSWSTARGKWVLDNSHTNGHSGWPEPLRTQSWSPSAFVGMQQLCGWLTGSLELPRFLWPSKCFWSPCCFHHH